MGVGCTKEEVIRVGTPFDDKRGEGVDFNSEITDSEAIRTLRELSKEAEDIEEPKDLKKVADTFFSLDRPKEFTTEILRYVWYQEDGSSILYSGSYDIYFILTKEQTNELKRILDQ